MSDWQMGSEEEESLWRRRLADEEQALEEEARQYAEAEINQPRKGTNMPSVNDAFPSKYLKVADLKGRAFKMKITEVVQETIGDDLKLVAYFDKGEKGLALNKTNATVIASKHGDDTDDWANADIELYPDKTMFQGSMVDCIRVRLPVPAAAEDEEVPF